MALWGISTTTETVTNNYAIPKFLSDVDKTRFRHNGFASSEGWTYRHYGDNKFSGLSTSYYDEILVPVFPLSGAEAGDNKTGLGAATPVAVFFKDVNNGSPISVAGGSTSFISTATSGEVHLVYNELVYCGAGATIRIDQVNAAGAVQASIVATATSTGVSLPKYGYFDGQITNRVAFTFTSPGASGINSSLVVNYGTNVVGTITDFSGTAAVKIISSEAAIRYNVGGAGTSASVGLGVTHLTVTA
jgi:hypothetical protein